jgi:hypothetical protein
VFEVFRFALFAVRTFFGVILLILALYAALWVFVKVHCGGDGQRGSGRRLAARQVVQRAGDQTRGSKDCCGSSRQREGLQRTALSTMTPRSIGIQRR